MRLAGTRGAQLYQASVQQMDGGTGERSCEDRCRETGRMAERRCSPMVVMPMNAAWLACARCGVSGVDAGDGRRYRRAEL